MKRVVPNPLISICLTPKEIKYIKKYAEKFGVSEAQIVRGLFRRGVSTLAAALAAEDLNENTFHLEMHVVKLGAL